MTEPANTQPDPNLGRVFGGRYRIDAIVGSGAAGTVYRASHATLGTPVALKVLNHHLLSNHTAQVRFRREARAATAFSHPNSVQVFDFGIERDGLPYLAMEFLEGRELLKVIYDDYPLSPERIVKLLSQLLSVLASAHEAGIVHRDLKPENIILVNLPGGDVTPEELVKVADFGIAKAIGPEHEDSIKLTQQGTVTGTPEYMSPEQARGDEIDGRTDLYAVGVILYEMLTATLPFTAESNYDVLLKHLSEAVVPPSSKRPDVHPGLEAVCLKALEKKPENRYADARAMLVALQSALSRPEEPAPHPVAREKIDSLSDRPTNPIPFAPPKGNYTPTVVEPTAAVQDEQRANTPVALGTQSTTQLPAQGNPPSLVFWLVVLFLLLLCVGLAGWWAARGGQ